MKKETERLSFKHILDASEHILKRDMTNFKKTGYKTPNLVRCQNIIGVSNDDFKKFAKDYRC